MFLNAAQLVTAIQEVNDRLEDLHTYASDKRRDRRIREARAVSYRVFCQELVKLASDAIAALPYDQYNDEYEDSEEANGISSRATAEAYGRLLAVSHAKNFLTEFIKSIPNGADLLALQVNADRQEGGK